jgi:hypothetical protein
VRLSRQVRLCWPCRPLENLLTYFRPRTQFVANGLYSRSVRRLRISPIKTRRPVPRLGRSSEQALERPSGQLQATRVLAQPSGLEADFLAARFGAPMRGKLQDKRLSVDTISLTNSACTRRETRFRAWHKDINHNTLRHRLLLLLWTTHRHQPRIYLIQALPCNSRCLDENGFRYSSW